MRDNIERAAEIVDSVLGGGLSNHSYMVANALADAGIIPRGVAEVTIRPEDPWPDAISDGLTLPCHQCGLIPSLDYLVPDEAWRRVIPAPQRLGVICLQCFLTSGGRPSDVEQIQVTGHAQTLVFKPVEKYSYPVRDALLRETDDDD